MSRRAARRLRDADRQPLRRDAARPRCASRGRRRPLRDTRRAQILLDRHAIRARRLVSLHGHNEARRVSQLLPHLAAGETHALVSDAGLPGVNDPGARLIAAVVAEGLPVTVLPGPSAVETALVASGLGATQYRFLGYLPRRDAELDALWEEARGWSYAAVAHSSHRADCRALLVRLAAADPERPTAVCRELTKVHEEVVRGTAAELAARFAAPPRGEITIVIAAAAPRSAPLGPESPP